jgi:hypothetical protein
MENANLARDQWLSMSDEELLRLCRCDTRRGVGPGGQKRNKTESAVQLTHQPSGISVMDDSSRSQHRNRQCALRKLRLELALALRLPPAPPADAASDGAKHAPSINNARFPLWAAQLLDALHAADYRISAAAATLGMSTGRLSKELAKSPALWQKINQERSQRQLTLLRQ